MSDNVFDLKNHRAGGDDSPYQRAHLTKNQWLKTTKYTTHDRAGLMPAGLVDAMEWLAPPETGSSSGSPGQRAIDENYMYVCVAKDHWKRTPLETF